MSGPVIASLEASSHGRRVATSPVASRRVELCPVEVALVGTERQARHGFTLLLTQVGCRWYNNYMTKAANLPNPIFRNCEHIESDGIKIHHVYNFDSWSLGLCEQCDKFLRNILFDEFKVYVARESTIPNIKLK
jgi:hypothetical protein